MPIIIQSLHQTRFKLLHVRLVQKNSLARQQAITIYQKATSQSIFTSYNSKDCIYEIPN